MKSTTTHSFELTYDELLRIIEKYIIKEDSSKNSFVTRTARKNKSICIDNMSISESSRIYLRIIKKA